MRTFFSRLTRHHLLLGIILLAALAVRLRGIDWPRQHPDEYPIAEWIEHGAPNRVYPGGLFVMIRPFRFLWEQGFVLHTQLTGLVTHPETNPVKPDYILMGRVFNALAGTLTVLFIYLATATVTRSRWAGLAAALLMAFAQYPVEHAHYAQSDIPMLFALSVTLFLWTRYLAREKTGWLIATGLACGFTAGTKFTLMSFMTPWVLFCLIEGFRRHRSTRWRATILYGLMGIVLFAAGFTLATPNVTSFRRFVTGMMQEKARVYGETNLNMGMLAGDDAVRIAAHVQALGKNLLTMGEGWLVLALLGLPLVLMLREYRKYWIPLVLLPLVYTHYWIFVAPWVRNQESLNFLPFAAIAAALAIAAAWRQWSHPLPRILVLVVFTIAGYVNVERGIRVSSIFGWPDTRVIATRWLERHQLPDSTSGTELYAGVTPRGRRVQVDMAARAGLANLREQGIDYLISQGSRGRRGMLHPVTGELYPHYEEAYQEFLAGSDYLKSWSLLPPKTSFTTFNSIYLPFYGINKQPVVHTINHPLPAPAFVSSINHETFYPRGHHLGGGTALEVTHHGVTFGVAAEDEFTEPVYLVVYTRERPAEVVVKGFGRKQEAYIAAYHHAVIPLQRPWWSRRLGHVEVVSVKDKPRDGITYVPCYLRVAFSPEEVSAMVAGLGHEPPPDILSASSLEPLIAEGASGMAYLGTGAAYYDQFARVNTTDQFNHYDRHPLHLRLETPNPAAGRSGVFSGTMNPHVERTSAGFVLRTDIRIVWDDPRLDGQPIPVRVLDEINGAELASLTHAWRQDLWLRDITMQVPPGLAGHFRMVVEAPHRATVMMNNLEISWTLNDLLVETYRNALPAEALVLAEQGRFDDAFARLDLLDSAPGVRHRMARLRARYEVAAMLPDAHDSRLASAVRGLLGVAPGHHQALQHAAAVGYAPAREAVARQTPDRPQHVKFLPFARLVGFQLDAAGVATVYLEALTDNPPAMNAALYRVGGKRPVVHGRQELFPNRPIAAGERFVVQFNIGGTDKKNLETLVLAIEANVQYHPGKLRIEGRTGASVPLVELLGGQAVR